MMGSRRSVEFSARTYEVLIEAYPASFRGEFEREMVLVFREHLTDQWQERGTFGLMVAWFRVLGDLAWTVPAEHLLEMRRRVAMKTAALAILLTAFAAVAYMVVLWGIMLIVCLPLMAIFVNRVNDHIVVELILYPVTFLAGLILSRVKPLLAPVVTVPSGIMSLFLVWGILALSEGGVTWGSATATLLFFASLALSALLGCVVARKASNRLSRFSVPWYQVAGALVVLVCSSFVAIILRLTLFTLHMDQLEADLQQVLGWCLFAVLGIYAVTMAYLVFLFVRSFRNKEARATVL